MAGGDDGPSDMAGAANMETVEPEVIADAVAWLVSDAASTSAESRCPWTTAT